MRIRKLARAVIREYNKRLKKVKEHQMDKCPDCNKEYSTTVFNCCPVCFIRINKEKGYLQ